MSESAIERIENAAKVAPNVPVLAYPGDVMEEVNALRAQLAAAQAPKTCATCTYLGHTFKTRCFNVKNESTHLYITDPANFGCIHHAPAAAAGTSESVPEGLPGYIRVERDDRLLDGCFFLEPERVLTTAP